MSPWRKDMFRQAVLEWIARYPDEVYYRTQTILKANEVQQLSCIVPLYLTLPLEIDPVIANEAFEQLKEIESILREGINKKLASVSNAFSRNFPVLGNDFSLGTIEDMESFQINFTLPLEDDINPHRKHPLDTRRFDDIKRRIAGIIDNTSIDFPAHHARFISRDIERLSHARQEVSHIPQEMAIQYAGYVDSFLRSITEDLRNEVQWELESLVLDACRQLIYQAYAEVLPANVVSDFERIGRDFNRLVDTTIGDAAFEEASKIDQKLSQRWLEEQRAEWEMLIAELPIDTPVEILVVLQNCCFIAKIAIFYRIIFDHINKFGTLPKFSHSRKLTAIGF